MKEHHVYRISKAIDNPEIAGRPAVFLGYRQSIGDIRRARMAMLRHDGGSGDEFWVNPHYVVPL